jgi:hypothetical protein
MWDAIIPALKHWIPSELRSTRMGDLLGSPHVASLFSSVRLSFSLGDSTRVASELPWKERNNLIIFLFLKILLIYFTTRYSRRVKCYEKRAVTDV